MSSEPSEWDEYNRPMIDPHPGMNGLCGINECGQPQHDNLPLCEVHGWDVWHHYQQLTVNGDGPLAAIRRRRDWQGERDKLLRAKLAEADQRAEVHAQQLAERRSRAGLVYYIRLGDMMKVGFTIDLKARLGGYPPYAEVLATHPGTLDVEAQVLAKFKHLVAHGKEWMRPDPELDAHIQHVRTNFPQDELVLR